MPQSPLFIQFFISTFVNLLISPKKTMKSLAFTKVTRAFYYYITLCGIVFICDSLILMVRMSTSSPLSEVNPMVGYSSPFLPLFIVIVPQVLALGILIRTTNFFGGTKGFVETTKSVLYGFTPAFFSMFCWRVILNAGILPNTLDFFSPVGIIVSNASFFIFTVVWSGYLITLGLSEFHEIPMRKAFHSVFSCFILILVIFAVVNAAIFLISQPYVPASFP